MITKTITKTTVEMLGVNRETLEREIHVTYGFVDETTLINDYCKQSENFVVCSYKAVVSHHKIKMSDRDFVMLRNTERQKGDFYRNIEFTKIRGIFCNIDSKRVYESEMVIFSDETEKDIPNLLPDGIYLVKILSKEKEASCAYMNTETFYKNGTEV